MILDLLRDWWALRQFDGQRIHGIWCDRHWEWCRRARRDGCDLDIAFLDTSLAYLATKAKVAVTRICCKLEPDILREMIRRSDRHAWPELMEEMNGRFSPLTSAEEAEYAAWPS